MIISGEIFDKVVALSKRRGFFFPTCEIYGGLNGLYDAASLGVLLEKRLIDFWHYHMYLSDYHMVPFDGALLGCEAMWKASGHIENFHDPLVDCKSCKARFRADMINLDDSCERCGKKDWSDVRQFNMMFKTSLGATQEGSLDAYLRPETAQNIFVQFKNIYNTARVKMPFGVMQVGKAFRNEITPRQFLFRVREFSQMEMEFFCHPDAGMSFHQEWVQRRLHFYKLIGLRNESIRVHTHSPEERSHYSLATVDIEFNFPFGWKELEGIAYRTNYDLSQHQIHSKKDLSVFDDAEQKSYIPHVVECSVGLGRLAFAVFSDAYHEEVIEDETRIVLKLQPFLAPISVGILPLTKNERLVAKDLYKKLLRSGISCWYDESGSIGKRYRRFDEIGTPWCVTIDSQYQESGCVTMRNRDDMKQEYVPLETIDQKILALLQRPC